MALRPRPGTLRTLALVGALTICLAMLFGSGSASASTTPSSPGSSSPSSTTITQSTPSKAEPIKGEIPAFRPNKGKLNFTLSASRALAEGGRQPVAIDPGSITVAGTLRDGRAKKLKATTDADAAQTDRQVMLLLDTSDSMKTGKRIESEREAAAAFVDQVARSPVRPKIGVVTFGEPAKVVLPPTDDLADVRRVINTSLNPDGDTAMFEAVYLAALGMDKTAIRSIVMISDGKNEDYKPKIFTKQDAQKALVGSGYSRILFTGVLVGDVRSRNIFEIAGDDAVVRASDRENLVEQLKAVVARGLEQQERALNASIDIPPEWADQPVSLKIEARSGSTPINFDVFDFPFKKAQMAAPATAEATPVAAQRSSLIPAWVLFAALVLVFGALAVLVTSTFGGLADQSGAKSPIVRRIEYFSVSGAAPARVEVTEQTTKLGDSALTRSAVGLMSRMARSSQLDRALDGQLESAGLPIRTAEWMLLHIAIAVGSALLLLLISGGQIAALVLGLLLGLAGPWLFLNFARSRRVSKFLAQLPDTLQLLAGSLAAGYSLPQAMDSVVRESGPPISLEFNRALIEARLGMPAEDALDGIAKRTDSTDFSWIVMAIRIQRDVGGNLAELLSSVAGTLRERERLRRQVSALSAEGRLSGLILGALPLVFGLYLMLTRPTYIAPLFDTKQGLLLLVIGTLLLAVGGFWMSKVIKVKV